MEGFSRHGSGSNGQTMINTIRASLPAAAAEDSKGDAPGAAVAATNSGSGPAQQQAHGAATQKKNHAAAASVLDGVTSATSEIHVPQPPNARRPAAVSPTVRADPLATRQQAWRRIAPNSANLHPSSPSSSPGNQFARPSSSSPSSSSGRTAHAQPNAMVGGCVRKDTSLHHDLRSMQRAPAATGMRGRLPANRAGGGGGRGGGGIMQAPQRLARLSSTDQHGSANTAEFNSACSDEAVAMLNFVRRTSTPVRHSEQPKAYLKKQVKSEGRQQRRDAFIQKLGQGRQGKQPLGLSITGSRPERTLNIPAVCGPSQTVLARPFARLQASSQAGMLYAAKYGSMIRRNQCWAPILTDLQAHTCWLQVDLGAERMVRAVRTQGAVSEPRWTTSFAVKTSIKGGGDDGTWQDHGEYTGNTDAAGVVTNTLVSETGGVTSAGVWARYIRFYPTAFCGYAGLRVEVVAAQSDSSLKSESVENCICTAAGPAASLHFADDNPKRGNIFASSEFSASCVAANATAVTKLWCPSRIEQAGRAWLQVNFDQVPPRRLAGLCLSGAGGYGYIEELEVHATLIGGEVISDTFRANVNHSDLVALSWTNPGHVTSVRIIPKKCHDHGAVSNLELFMLDKDDRIRSFFQGDHPASNVFQDVLQPLPLAPNALMRTSSGNRVRLSVSPIAFPLNHSKETALVTRKPPRVDETLLCAAPNDVDPDDGYCLICYGETASHRVSRECKHVFCRECISESLRTMLEMGQMPPFCPLCRCESVDLAVGKADPTVGRIRQKELRTLANDGIITEDLELRLLRQIPPDAVEPEDVARLIICPHRCGRYLQMPDPQYYISQIDPTKPSSGYKRVPRQGVCPCAARICTQCHHSETVADPQLLNDGATGPFRVSSACTEDVSSCEGVVSVWLNMSDQKRYRLRICPHDPEDCDLTEESPFKTVPVKDLIADYEARPSMCPLKAHITMKELKDYGDPEDEILWMWDFDMEKKLNKFAFFKTKDAKVAFLKGNQHPQLRSHEVLVATAMVPATQKAFSQTFPGARVSAMRSVSLTRGGQAAIFVWTQGLVDRCLSVSSFFECWLELEGVGTCLSVADRSGASGAVKAIKPTMQSDLVEIETADISSLWNNHKCAVVPESAYSVDKESQKLMAKLGRPCPACGSFIEKNGGCDFVMCGTNSHGSLKTALERGGCGFQFDWNTGKPIRTFYIGFDGKRVTGYIGYNGEALDHEPVH